MYKKTKHNKKHTKKHTMKHTINHNKKHNINHNKKHNKKKHIISIKKIKNLKGGKFIGEGSYGCVIQPAIPCKNIDLKNVNFNNKMISKIIINPQETIKTEINISNKLNSIDPQQKYFITFKDFCILKNIPNNRSNAVKVHHYDKRTLKNFKLKEKKILDKKYCPIDLDLKPINLIMPYAGYNLLDLYTQKPTDNTFLLIRDNLPKYFKDCFKNLLLGLYKLHNARIVNRDIKEENITANYNEKTKKVELRFIDFGLSEYLTPNYCNKYENIILRGSLDYIPPEIIISYIVNEYYDRKDINYIYKKVLSFYNEYDLKLIYKSLKEFKILNEFNNVLNDLIYNIYNNFDHPTFLPTYFGSSSNKFNGYLQKGDIYGLGITIYEFLEIVSQFINVKKDDKLYNLLLNMINLNPDKRYNVIDCLKHPYFK